MFAAALAVAAGCLLSPSARPAAAQASVLASVDRRSVAADQTLTLTIQVSGADQVGEPELSPLSDLAVISQFRSQSVSMAGGRTSVDVSFQYVLQPRSEGTITIPSIEVPVGGQVLKTRPIAIEVTAARGGGRGQPSPISPQTPVAPPRLSPLFEPDEPRGEVIVSCEADKQQAYVGEQVLLTFSVCYSRRLAGMQYEPASTEGFRAQELPSPPPRYEIIDGERYVVKQDLRLLFPTAPGQLTIGSAKVEYTSGFWDPVVETRGTEPITVEVSRLPQTGRPEGFSGVVGSLDVRAVLDRDAIKQGEAATLTAVVRGWGNLEAMKAPIISLPAGVREYRATESRRFEPTPVNGGYRVEGEALFDNVIIPTTVGDITIPPIRIGYFDPEAQRYRVARSEPVVLHVERGEPGAIADAAGPGQAGQLRPLPDKLNRRSQGDLVPAAVIASQVLAIGWLIGTGAVRRRRSILERNPKLARAKRARRTAIRHIGQARKLPPREAAGGIVAALAGYVADKLDVPAATVSAGTAEELLSAHVVGPEGKRLAELLRSCDGVRFAPSREADTRALADQALDLVRDLERQIGRGAAGGSGGNTS